LPNGDPFTSQTVWEALVRIPEWATRIAAGLMTVEVVDDSTLMIELSDDFNMLDELSKVTFDVRQ
jgi:hypothetical protein